MSYKAITSKSVKKTLEKIPLPWRNRILLTMLKVLEQPWIGGKLKGEHKGKRRARVWPYRIVYSIDEPNKIVNFLELEHRGSVSYD